MTHYFYPLDITYETRDDKPIIILYGRDEHGKRIIVEYPHFEPYFIIDANPAQLGDIKSIIVEHIYRITHVEPVKRIINGAERNLFSVFVNIPKGLPLIKATIGHKINDAYEYDILFTRRFLIDKDIVLFTKTLFDGVSTDSHTYTATHIGPSEIDATYAQPRALALDIETYLPRGEGLNMREHPILMIGLYSENYCKVLTWKAPAKKFEQQECVEVLSSEADMLKRLSEVIAEFSPDVIVGYNSDNFDFAYIYERAKKLRVELPLGVNGNLLSVTGKEFRKANILGMFHFDLYQFVRRVMRTSLQTDTLSLDEVAAELLGERKAKIDILNLARDWDENNDLDKYIEYNIKDIAITYRLYKKIFPNVLELVKIVRISPFDLSRFSYSQLVEWYLIYKAAKLGVVVPNRSGYNEQQTRSMQHVKGGFVYEPKPGLYENLVVYDFRSLYPSIIASHNISPDTLNCSCCVTNTIKGVRATYHFCTNKQGFISTAIKELITMRAHLKNEIKKNKDDPLLNARSIALKLLANSMYGYLGFAVARWYSIESADATTSYGRQYVQGVIERARKEGFGVLYGDTDSAMLLLNGKSRDDAVAFCNAVNKDLPGLMELEIESFYPRAIFVATKGSESGAKKKYAMIDDKGILKIRGFETVRRNWSPVAKHLQKDVLQFILRDGAVEKAVTHVKMIIKKLQNHELSVKDVSILTQLQKEIGDYTAVGPHVAAAQRMKNQGINAASGTYIRYVVVNGKGLIRDRVRLPEEKDAQNYDSDYYITHQILPSVDRIFAALGYTVDELLQKGNQTNLGQW